MLARLLHSINRKKAPVIFNDLARTSPVCSNFGWERGTPIDRYYIENFLRANGHLIRGRVLEVGDSSYSKRFTAGGVESFDALHVTPGEKSATIIGDLTDIATLPASAFDCFICTQTFQCIYEIRKAIEGAHHLLKPGGILLATNPGMGKISRKDADRFGEYWRFTTDSITKLFLPVFGGGITVASFGNVLAATAFLQGVAVEDLPDRSLLDFEDPDYEVIITLVARKENTCQV